MPCDMSVSLSREASADMWVNSSPDSPGSTRLNVGGSGGGAGVGDLDTVSASVSLHDDLIDSDCQ